MNNDVDKGLNAMIFLRMKGPYKLDMDTIDAEIARKSPGNYALGRNLNGKFRAGYVGRSDSDIRAFLKSRVGVTKQLLFKFSYARSPEAAFRKECKLYHGLTALGNYSHPTRPKGTDWQCPRCDIFDVPSVGMKRKPFAGYRKKSAHGRH
jgi:hypothetical protein